MSYESVWGIPFRELRDAGFRPLTDQAWAGVKSQKALDELFGRAAIMGLTVIVPITRGELKVRFQYSCDMSMLSGRDLGFRWTYVPFNDLTADEVERRNWSAVSHQRRAGYGVFRSEAEAVAWKLIVT